MFLSMFVVKGGALVGCSIGIPMILALPAFLKTVGSDLPRALARLSPFRYLDDAAISAALLALSLVLYRKKEFAVQRRRGQHTRLPARVAGGARRLPRTRHRRDD